MKRTDHPFKYEGNLEKRYPRATLPHEGEVNLGERQQRSMEAYWQARREADAELDRKARVEAEKKRARIARNKKLAAKRKAKRR